MWPLDSMYTAALCLDWKRRHREKAAYAYRIKIIPTRRAASSSNAAWIHHHLTKTYGLQTHTDIFKCKNSLNAMCMINGPCHILDHPSPFPASGIILKAFFQAECTGACMSSHFVNWLGEGSTYFTVSSGQGCWKNRAMNISLSQKIAVCSAIEFKHMIEKAAQWFQLLCKMHIFQPWTTYEYNSSLSVIRVAIPTLEIVVNSTAAPGKSSTSLQFTALKNI